MATNLDVGLLLLRLVVGLIMTGHGAQKLFGWFGGRGLAAHVQMIEKLGMRPSRFWATTNALGEFLGGLGLALGLFTPLATGGLIGSMLVAIIKVHWAKGLWNTKGGFEYPLTLITVALAVGISGPGRLALDPLLGLTRFELSAFLIVLAATVLVVFGWLLFMGNQQGGRASTQ